MTDVDLIILVVGGLWLGPVGILAGGILIFGCVWLPCAVVFLRCGFGFLYAGSGALQFVEGGENNR